MAALDIGIDLCQNPLRVCSQVLGTVLVEKGSKGVNWNRGQGESHSGLGFWKPAVMVDDSDEDFDMQANKNRLTRANNISPSPELIGCFEDARSVTKSYFGSTQIGRAFVVVPNNTNNDTKLSVEAAANRAFVHVLQVIPEYIAVAAAYADKTKPTETSMVTIISSTAGGCDVYVVSISPNSEKSYEYRVERQQSHHDDKNKSGGGLFGSVVNAVTSTVNNVTFEADALTKSIELMIEDALRTKKAALEKVVFVGKSAELEKMREIVNKGFTKVKEWKEIDDSEQLAAIGAAVLASLGEPI